MEKALQNPDYKKIWEKVMMNRHPEAKNFEEALRNEKEYFDCFFSYNDITSYVGDMYRNLKINIQAYNRMTEEYIEELSFRKKAEFLANFETKYTLFGRPITLEDILILCKNNDIRKYAISNKRNIISLYETYKNNSRTNS